MIVVLIIGILLAIAIPNFVAARETSRAKSCIGNLAQINSAKTQCSMDYNLAVSSTATFKIDGVTATAPGQNGTYQLINTNSNLGYMHSIPHCASGGSYTTGAVDVTPTCSIATTAVTANYQVGGSWYHGY